MVTEQDLIDAGMNPNAGGGTTSGARDVPALLIAALLVWIVL